MRERTQDLELINFIGDSPSMALTDFRLSPDQSNGGFIVILADDGKTRAITHVAREAVERMLGDYDSRLSRSDGASHGTRCWRGLDQFKAYIWSAVVAHNLVLFARLKPA